MSIAKHLDALKLRHAHIENHIEEEQKRPMPNTGILHVLKRNRLHVKEEITKLSQ